MKRITLILIGAATIFSEPLKAQSTFAAVIDSAIKFLRTPPPVPTENGFVNRHVVELHFSIIGEDNVVLSGGYDQVCELALATFTSQPTGTKYFLKTPHRFKFETTRDQYQNKRFSAQSNSSSITNPNLIDLFTFTFSDSTANSGIINRKTISLRNNLSVNRRVVNDFMGSNKFISVEYFIYGFVDPKNPGLYATLCIRFSTKLNIGG